MSIPMPLLTPAINIIFGKAKEEFMERFEQYQLEKGVAFLNLIMSQGFKTTNDARKFYKKCSADDKFMKSLMSKIHEALRTSSPTALLTIASIIGIAIDKDNIKFNLSSDEAIMLSALDAIPENEIRLFWILYKSISTGNRRLLPGLKVDGTWQTDVRPINFNLQFDSLNYLFPATKIEKPFSQEGLIAIMNDLVTRRVFLVNASQEFGGGIQHFNFGIGRITDQLYHHVDFAMEPTNRSIFGNDGFLTNLPVVSTSTQRPKEKNIRKKGKK
jgi:hypothetical protein